MTLNVLNPVAQQLDQRTQPARRESSLEGKVVGLYWNFKHGGNIALERVAEHLKSRYGVTETRTYHGSLGSSNRYTTKRDVERIASECDAVVGSTAD